MPRTPNEVPVYSRHKARNLVVTTVRLANGQRKGIYLGPWKSAASKIEHARIAAIVAANGGIYPDEADDLTINEALVRYIRSVNGYYVQPDGTPAESAEQIRYALRPLKELFGPTPIKEFGPVQLKAVRAVLIEKGIVRKQINRAAMIIRAFFRWCVEESIVGESVWNTLRAVKALDEGRSGAKESKPRQPADPAVVEAALPFMPPAIGAVVQLLRLAGARPTEILTMRPCDLDRSGDVWKYAPATHKTKWKGKSRTIFIGPKAKIVLAPWLLGTPAEECIFSPARSEEMRNRGRSKKRRTPLWRSHAERNDRKRAKKRKLGPSDRYDHHGLCRAINRACVKARMAPFTSYQLRHLKAAELREKYGLEFVRATLGHSFMAMSADYAKSADAVLASAAAEVG